MDLYYAIYSPPCRAVLLTAEYIGVSFNSHVIDVMKGEHLNSDYEKINVLKQIPTLVDGDFKLGESRAIMIYLVEKYGKQNARILPSDPAGRALVNQAMHFDADKLFRYTKDYYFPVLLKTQETHSPVKYERLKDAFGVLDKILEGQDYVAGRNLTIADITIITTVTFAEVLGFDVNTYEHIKKWIDRVRVALPGYKKINIEGLENFKMRIVEIEGN